MKRYIIILVLLIGVSGATVYQLSIKGTVKVVETNLTVSPETFTVTLSKGSTCVKEITIKNSGSAKNIYFKDLVEGTDPDKIDVTFHDVYGNAITSSKKLNIPSGTSDNPTEVKVHVWLTVDDDATEGEYTVIIQCVE